MSGYLIACNLRTIGAAIYLSRRNIDSILIKESEDKRTRDKLKHRCHGSSLHVDNNNVGRTGKCFYRFISTAAESRSRVAPLVSNRSSRTVSGNVRIKRARLEELKRGRNTADICMPRRASIFSALSYFAKPPSS